MLFSFGKKDQQEHDVLDGASESESSRGVIEMLSKAMAAFDAESREHNRGMLEHSRRLEEATRLDDIQSLKRALLRETDRLRQAVREKESRDTAQIEKLSLQVSALNREVQSVRTASERDRLTGIFNRRAFDRHLDDLITRNTAQAEPFALLMIDMDDFKRINDAYGHLAGAQSLAKKTTIWLGRRKSARTRWPEPQTLTGGVFFRSAVGLAGNSRYNRRLFCH